MCGIWGVFQTARSKAFTTTDVQGFDIESVRKVLNHRGPDANGIWMNDDGSVLLGHHRLAIVDLSTAGAQPMQSQSSNSAITFNGEIYNHKSLRDEFCTNVEFNGHSDTETLVEALANNSVDTVLQKTKGMFAFGYYSHIDESLTLVRDRFGEKPLYYGYVDSDLVFASELKVFHCHAGFKKEFNVDILEEYLTKGCIGGDRTVFKNVFKLLPGHKLVINKDHIASTLLPTAVSWWSPVDVALECIQKPLVRDFEAIQLDRESQSDHGLQNVKACTDDRAYRKVEEQLCSAVERQMEADVPLGAFLSGGIDSSLITALAQSQSDQAIATFSIGFDDSRYDESEHAEAVAKYLGTNHTTLFATSDMALDLVPSLSQIFCEPFADSSQLPTLLVSQLTKQHVTVALSGDGGDELFGGYNRHIELAPLWNKLNKLPSKLRYITGQSICAISPDTFDSAYNWIGTFASKFKNGDFTPKRTMGEKLHKAGQALNATNQYDLFQQISSMNRNASDLIDIKYKNHSKSYATPNIKYENLLTDTYYDHNNNLSFMELSYTEQMLLADTVGYMTNDVLVKVDRASMAHSLEIRAPFLDDDVYKAAWFLPIESKVNGKVGKQALRDILYQYVPRELIERPKMGFAVPLDEWLRGPLREWAEDLLSLQSLRDVPVLNFEAVQTLWREHLLSRQHNAQQLWCVLQLVSWCRHWRPVFS